VVILDKKVSCRKQIVGQHPHSIPFWSTYRSNVWVVKKFPKFGTAGTPSPWHKGVADSLKCAPPHMLPRGRSGSDGRSCVRRSVFRISRRLFVVNHHRRSAQVWHVFSMDFTVLPAHPHFHPQSEWAIPAFAFPAITGNHLPTPEGWKAE